MLRCLLFKRAHDCTPVYRIRAWRTRPHSHTGRQHYGDVDYVICTANDIITIWFIMMAPITLVSVKKALLQKMIHVGISAFRAPNQGLGSSLCCWVAGHGLAEKKCLFTDTGIITTWFITMTPITLPADNLTMTIHRVV